MVHAYKYLDVFLQILQGSLCLYVYICTSITLFCYLLRPVSSHYLRIFKGNVDYMKVFKNLFTIFIHFFLPDKLKKKKHQ